MVIRGDRRLHIILISAQVTTKRGVPILQEVTFGAFAEMARRDDGIRERA